MKRQRRGLEDMGIAFLDVICCGFGAIILLLMISKTVEPIVLEQSSINLDGQMKKLQQELFQIRGETQILNRDMTAKREQLDMELRRIAILRTELATLEARYASITRGSLAESEYVGQLELALQSLTEEMERLLSANHERQNDLIGGIPVDSEYVIFVIDTSGSMFEYAWPRLLREVINILDIYPDLKGIQVLDDQGDYMFPSFRNEWIPDTPARRDAIVQRLRGWNAFSNSSPVEGIQAAIRTFYQPGRKISIFVLGDDLQPAESITRVVNTVDRLNRRGLSEERLVRIHAVGFPVIFQVVAPHQQRSAERFAALMREITYRNGGTFVGLSDYRPEVETARPTL